MDTYYKSLRKRINRETASYQKRRTVKYFQFPHRPVTQNIGPCQDEDEMDPFMFRTNTRLSFRPLSRYVERESRLRKLSPKKSIEQRSVRSVPQIINEGKVSHNYKYFRPPDYLIRGASVRNPLFILFKS